MAVKILSCFLAVLSLLLFNPQGAEAKRRLPSAGAKVGSSAKKVTTSSKGILTSVKFRGDRRGIVATFSNLSAASKVSYSLTYSQRGILEGAGGSLTDLSGPQTRELLFGTCSHGVCRYHTGIKNARFVVTTTLKSGKKVSKPYRLKV